MKMPSKCKLEKVVEHLKKELKKAKGHDPKKKHASKKMHKAGKKAGKALKKDMKIARGEKKMEKVMHEFKEGSLHSGSKKGPKVSSRKQAIAIGMSEARKAKRGKK